jgi:hypothetical protein
LILRVLANFKNGETRPKQKALDDDIFSGTLGL